MTVEQLREIITDKYGITADRKKGFHPEVISAIIELAFNQVIYNTMINAITFSDYGQLDPYIKTYKNVPVLCDSGTNEYYSNLPVAIVPLPMNRGIRAIGLMQDRKTFFYYRENSTSEIYENTEFAQINTNVTYEVENSTIRYDERMTQDIANVGVLMKLIPVFREYDDEDIIPAPAGKEMDIITAVEELLNAKIMDDYKINARPDDFTKE